MAVLAGQLISIQVTVDAATILAQGQGANPNNVVFMTDNNAAGGSSNEGTAELNTACHVGDTIQWTLSNQNPSNGISVAFLAMRDSSGTVFGFNPPHGDASMYQGEATSAGQETYQILILVGGTTTYQWDPFISAS